jgi:uncharacterized protein
MTSINKIADKVKSGEYKTLKPNDTFKFNCKRCGKCCIEIDDIMLNPYDVYRIGKKLNIPSSKVIDDYVTFVLGSNSKMPIAVLKQKDYKAFNRELKVCPFLTSNIVGQCSCLIHDAKPFVCAVYPLGRLTKINSGGITEVSFFEQNTNCPHENHTEIHKLSDWIDKFNLKEHDVYSNMHNAFISQLMKTINLTKMYNNKDITDKTKDMFFNTYINTLFIGFDLNKDIQVDLKERYDKMLELSKMYVDYAKMTGFDISGIL